MKQDIFNQYVKKVCDRFGITELDLFSKTKKRDVTDARHLLYHLCLSRNIQIHYIQKFLRDKGYEVAHTSIIYGANSVKNKVSEDKDYTSVIRSIESSVIF
jgi:chromosomal replication initiation ATPase DnaA